MTLLITPTESDVFKALGDFIVAVAGIDTNQAQENRVPEPAADIYSMMNTVRWPRLSTNLVTFDPIAQQKTIMQSSECVVQVNIHGSANASNLLATLFRDEFATDFFEAYPNISPLYAEDPRQAPFNNAEQQIEDDWTIDFHLQVNLSVSLPQQSATELEVELYNVDQPPSAPAGDPSSLDFSDPDNSQNIPSIPAI